MRLLPDLLVVFGAAALFAGVWVFSLGAALIVLGLLLCGVGLLVERAQ